MSFLRTSVSSAGKFVYGVHKPKFTIANLREKDFIESIGSLSDGTNVLNDGNFPHTNIKEENSDVIYEIANPFPFRGTTYINSAWADKNAADPGKIKIAEKKPFSFKKSLGKFFDDTLYENLDRPIRITIAQASTDPAELVKLAETVCKFVYDNSGDVPTGLYFKKDENSNIVPDIKDHDLFEIIANNPSLPDSYKNAMVLIPGIQGTSEITAALHDEENKSHVFEYLRRNSYIPWGHFASNMANNSIRYKTSQLSLVDMQGMRHLYYQRTYIRVAEQLGIAGKDNIEQLRLEILDKLYGSKADLKFNRSLWGWNFGFGFSHSGYNLHASHQQIHQQFAMIPKYVNTDNNGEIPSYSSGDLVEEFVLQYREKTGKNFFENYLCSINSNRRIDGAPSKPASLKVFEDENIILFVPKAQTSQFELQLMPKKQCGNVLEADINMRTSIDNAILMAVQTLETLGAQLITSIEYSKRFDLPLDHDQNFLYSFLPKLPRSPGAFSEAQLRWINGHYPEDFALACRQACT